MTANEAPSNIIISFVKCTILYLFWYHKIDKVEHLMQ